MPANMPLRLEMPFDGQDGAEELRLTALHTPSKTPPRPVEPSQRAATSTSVQSRMDRLLQRLTGRADYAMAGPRRAGHARQPRTANTAETGLRAVQGAPVAAADASHGKLPPRHNTRQPVASSFHVSHTSAGAAPPLPRLAGQPAASLSSKHSDTTVDVSAIAPAEHSDYAALLSASLGSVPPRGAVQREAETRVQTSAAEVTRSHEAADVSPRLSPGLAGLLCVAAEVWQAFGLFALPPHLPGHEAEVRRTPRHTLASHGGEDAVPGGETGTMYDRFVRCVTQLYMGQAHDARSAAAAAAAATRQSMPHSDDGDNTEAAETRNVLWHVLYNALCYCSVNCMPGRQGDDKTEAVCSRLPVRLTWRVMPPLQQASGCDSGSASGDARGQQPPPQSPPRRTSRDDTPNTMPQHTLPTALWVFCLRTLSELGYGRDLFYLQTPCAASAHELLLALLWLTRRCELVAVAAFVKVNGSHRYLLRYHTATAEDTRGSEALRGNKAAASSSPAASSSGDASRALCTAFPQAMMWPPLSFNEDRVIAYRLRQIDDLVTQPASSVSDDDDDDGTHATRVTTCLTRRVMALRRLVTLALNKLEQALTQHTAQLTALGLHSVLDAQLCQAGQQESYAHVMDGLRQLSGLEARVEHQLASLAAAGTLVAEAIDAEHNSGEEGIALCLAPEQLQHALDADEATWLRRTTANATAEAEEADTSQATPALTSVLSKFRATRTREALHDVWRSLQRRQRAGSNTPGGASIDGPDTSTPREAGNASAVSLDTRAQANAAASVRRNVAAQYTLQAALAAELTLMARQPRAGKQARVRIGPPLPPAPSLLQLSTRKDAVTTACAAAAGSAMLQVTAVGQPAAQETTSARIEFERLAGLLRGITGQSSAQAQRTLRMQRCAALLDELKAVYGLRPVLAHVAADNREQQQS